MCNLIRPLLRRLKKAFSGKAKQPQDLAPNVAFEKALDKRGSTGIDSGAMYADRVHAWQARNAEECRRAQESFDRSIEGLVYQPVDLAGCNAAICRRGKCGHEQCLRHTDSGGGDLMRPNSLYPVAVRGPRSPQVFKDKMPLKKDVSAAKKPSAREAIHASGRKLPADVAPRFWAGRGQEKLCIVA